MQCHFTTKCLLIDVCFSFLRGEAEEGDGRFSFLRGEGMVFSFLRGERGCVFLLFEGEGEDVGFTFLKGEGGDKT